MAKVGPGHSCVCAGSSRLHNLSLAFPRRSSFSLRTTRTAGTATSAGASPRRGSCGRGNAQCDPRPAKASAGQGRLGSHRTVFTQAPITPCPRWSKFPRITRRADSVDLAIERGSSAGRMILTRCPRVRRRYSCRCRSREESASGLSSPHREALKTGSGYARHPALQ